MNNQLIQIHFLNIKYLHMTCSSCGFEYFPHENECYFRWHYWDKKKHKHTKNSSWMSERNFKIYALPYFVVVKLLETTAPFPKYVKLFFFFF